MGSVCLGPKVIQLSGAHCTMKYYYANNCPKSLVCVCGGRCSFNSFDLEVTPANEYVLGNEKQLACNQ